MGEPHMGRAEPFRGTASEVCYSQSPWFNSEEIPAEKWDGFDVTIEEVRARRGVKFNKGRARDVELFLKFVGIEKELRVNITIRRVLDTMISPVCGDWFGKRITLFVQGGIDTSEGKKNGVRVRDRLPPQDAPRPSAPKPSGRAEKVLASMAEFRKVAPPADYESMKAAAGIVGKTPAQLTAEDIERIVVALPEPFRPAS